MMFSNKYGEVYRLWFGKHLAVGLSKAEDLEVNIKYLISMSV